MDFDKVQAKLLDEIKQSDRPREVWRAPELKNLAEQLKNLPRQDRPEFGRRLNQLKQNLAAAITEKENQKQTGAVESLDITAPFDISTSDRSAPRPQFWPASQGTLHPIMSEIGRVVDILTRMGFHCRENRQLDDDYHMFESLNFPAGHPARDNFDTFRTEEGFIPPAHTTAMDNRMLAGHLGDLTSKGYIAEASWGRTFRNEDADVTHDHTFYQYDGVFVSKDAHLSDLLGTMKTFFENYFEQDLRVKTQPGYFPFTEPSLEFQIEKPAALNGGGKGGEWLEMLGCGMIHPNVLAAAGIDPKIYRGFAWGGGIERLVMLKYGVEDLRHFESGKLAFLREFE
ncbi:MAG: hypothetical protein LBM73_00355 [Candidatus Nomurabacteria bacterium]|jgi:phenylalanyl-tRNA synthetase alpha chain|nr:hypothetical protein [Candidatus Nomurabacteria bacterium]